MIDAGHTYEHVVHDIQKVMNYFDNPIIIIDDYGNPNVEIKRAIDEAIRHAITKMAQLHFVGAEPYRKRVIQLGEDPNRVFNFGAIQLDHLHKITLLNFEEFEKEIDFKLAKNTKSFVFFTDNEDSSSTKTFGLGLEHKF